MNGRTSTLWKEFNLLSIHNIVFKPRLGLLRIADEIKWMTLIKVPRKRRYISDWHLEGVIVHVDSHISCFNKHIDCFSSRL